MFKFLALMGIVLGAISIFAGQTQAAQAHPNGADLAFASLVYPCKGCAVYRTSKPGDTVMLNPQPLPPRLFGKATLFRR